MSKTKKIVNNILGNDSRYYSKHKTKVHKYICPVCGVWYKTQRDANICTRDDLGNLSH